MKRYQVKFVKHLLSSDGHPFSSVQRVVEVRRAKSHARATRAAQRRFERSEKIPDWTLHADHCETVETPNDQ